MEQYSRRHLTVPADRLNAISAMAEVLSKHIDQTDAYLAGHWRSSFPQSLMWCNFDKFGVKYHSSKEYVAPSWSWASVRGEVLFELTVDEDVDFTIIDCRVQVTDPIMAPFGSVSSGCLHIRAKIIWGNATYSEEENEFQGIIRRNHIHIPLNSLPARLNRDGPFLPSYLPDGRMEETTDGTMEDPEPVLVVVMSMPTDSYPEMKGMVVKEAGDGLYRRVGWVDNLEFIYKRAWAATKYMYECPESDGLKDRPLDMELVKKTRETWYNIFEVRKLKII